MPHCCLPHEGHESGSSVSVLSLIVEATLDTSYRRNWKHWVRLGIGLTSDDLRNAMLAEPSWSHWKVGAIVLLQPDLSGHGSWAICGVTQMGNMFFPHP